MTLSPTYASTADPYHHPNSQSTALILTESHKMVWNSVSLSELLLENLWAMSEQMWWTASAVIASLALVDARAAIIPATTANNIPRPCSPFIMATSTANKSATLKWFLLVLLTDYHLHSGYFETITTNMNHLQKPNFQIQTELFHLE